MPATYYTPLASSYGAQSSEVAAQAFDGQTDEFFSASKGSRPHRDAAQLRPRTWAATCGKARTNRSSDSG